MSEAIIRGQVRYAGGRAGSVYIGLFGREPGPPRRVAFCEGPGPFEIRGVEPGEYVLQAVMSEERDVRDRPPRSFAAALHDMGRPLSVRRGAVIEGLVLSLEDKPRESVSCFVDGVRVELG